MLQAIEEAIALKGRSNTAIAREVARTPQTVTGWFSGRFYIPVRIRNALCDAIGAQIDWDAYERDYYAAQAERAARPAPAPAPRPIPRPAPPPAPPQMPATATQRPATTPRRITATPPTQKPQTPARGPENGPARKGGLFGFLFDPNDDGMKFA